MAPIKFEENIKDKLENRRLSPSVDGWSKLSERLDAEDKTSKNSVFWWLSIAAGIILMIAISIQFFNTNDVHKVIPQVVEKEFKEVELEKKVLEKETIESVQLAGEEINVEAKKNKVDVTEESQIIKFKSATHTNIKNASKVAEQNTVTKEETLKKEAENLLNEAVMKNAIADALDMIKVEKTSVSDREIDSLLKLASKELFKDKLQNETSKTVDADALLLSVEEDMGQSFRSKVFDALKGSYETVKTAVVQRNN